MSIDPTTLLQYLDYAGVALFAATGALVAARKGLDILAFIFFASITGVGGGTLRDVLLSEPVFWISNPLYVAVPIVVAVLVYLTAQFLVTGYGVLLWLDAIGLSAYAVMGAAKAMDTGTSPLVAIIMGMMTATIGGVLRDVLAQEPSALLRRELYVTAALAGATVFSVLSAFSVIEWIAVAAGFAVAFIARGGALLFHWTLPGYRPFKRPNRDGNR